MSRLGLWEVVSTILALSAGIAAACGGDAPRSESTPGDLPSTVDGVHQRMLAAMSRSGEIFHATIETKVDQGPYSYVGAWDAWIAPERNAARVSVRVGLGADGELQAIEIVVADANYRRENNRTRKGKALTCRGSDAPLLTAVLGCRGFLENSSTTLRANAQYEGRAALALVTTGTSRGEDESWTFIDTLYIDPMTYLPITQEQTGTLDIGEKYPVRGTTRFSNEFVAADSQPSDLFDPAAIGYVPEDPKAPGNQPGRSLTPDP